MNYGDLRIDEALDGGWYIGRSLGEKILLSAVELRWLCISAGPALLQGWEPKVDEPPGKPLTTPFDLEQPLPIPGQEVLDLES